MACIPLAVEAAEIELSMKANVNILSAASE